MALFGRGHKRLRCLGLFARVDYLCQEIQQSSRMSLFSYFRISKPSEYKVPEAEVDSTFKRLRSRTFWGATVAYSLYYVCRMALSVVKQPLIDDGLLSAGQLGIIGSAMLFVYAVGKFVNGFIADRANARWHLVIALTACVILNALFG